MMYEDHEEQDVRDQESSVGYDHNGDEDLDESISLANELLPEYYDIAASVGSQEAYVMERYPADDTRMIVQQLLDRVELLSRENSLLKRLHFQDGGARATTDNNYLDMPLGGRKTAERANWSESRGNFTSGQVSSAFSCLQADEVPVREESKSLSPGYHSSIVGSATMPSQLHVTFSDHPEESSATDSVQSEVFRARVIRAIQRHRTAVSDLRNIICSELQNGTYNVELLPEADRERPRPAKWQATGVSPPRSSSPPHRVNLRKPIWFRDILSNE